MRFESVNKFFTRRGGDLIILAFSLLLAFFMWSMYRMTKRYSAVLNYKVVVESNIAGHARSAISENSLVIRGQATGFFIFQQRSGESSGKNNIVLPVDSKKLKPYNLIEDMFYTIASDVEEPVQEFLGSDFKLEGVSSDTLIFRFPKQANRKVPVVAKLNVTFAPQYDAPSGISLKPDSVVIYGNHEVISKVDSVVTQNIRFSNVDEAVQGVVKIQPIKGVSYSAEEIYYAMPVVRYFENSVKVKIEGQNFPSGANVLFIPQDLRIVYRMPFNIRREVSESEFKIVVDSDSIGKSNIVRPVIEHTPEGLFDIRTEPVFIECLVN